VTGLADLEPIVAAGRALTPQESARVAACPDLVSVGTLGEAARRSIHGARVTYGRVCVVGPGDRPTSRGEAGEVRLIGVPASRDEARARVREAVPLAAGAPLSAFSLADLVEQVGGDHMALAELAAVLASDGLDAVAEVPVDRLGDLENAIEVVRAVRHGGLQTWRATIDAADPTRRPDLIHMAEAIQAETGAFRAFAPLPRVDPRETPATGYDDVRTVTVARVVCRAIRSIQVDWTIYGPKLAQVAIAYGADDLDGVAPGNDAAMGSRRSPREEIERHIRAAFADPVERNGRFETRA